MTNEPMSQCANEPMNQCTNEPMSQMREGRTTEDE